MNRKGFTLLEILISIMILAVGIVAVLPLFAVGTQSHKRAIDQTHASRPATLSQVLAWSATRM